MHAQFECKLKSKNCLYHDDFLMMTIFKNKKKDLADW